MDQYIPGTTIAKPTVKLLGQDGNAFGILGTVQKALQRAGAPKEVQEAFYTEATSGDYDHLLRTAMQYTEVE